MNSLDPWRVMQPGTFTTDMVVPRPYYGNPFMGEHTYEGVFVGAAPPHSFFGGYNGRRKSSRVGADLTAHAELDDHQVLHGKICIDGRCHEASIDLAPVIEAVMVKIAQHHAQLHDGSAPAPHLAKISGVAPDYIEVAGGACGSRVYRGISSQAVAGILQMLRDGGAEVSGQNPWGVVAHDLGVALRGTWYPDQQTLRVEVTASAAPCDAVWSTIDSMLRQVAVSGEVPFDEIDRAIGAAADELIGALVERHYRVAGWWSDLPHDLKKIADVAGDTLKSLKGPISAAAGAAASAFVGPAGALLASQVTGALADASGGDYKSAGKEALAVAEQAASQNPQVSQVVNTAKAAFAHSAAAHHVAATAHKASAGHPKAIRQIAQIAKAATQGDSSAQSLISSAQNIAGASGLDLGSLTSALGGIF